MKKLATILIAFSLLAPNLTLAYVVSGGAGSYSAPIRSYSAPIRSYTPSIRSYSAPSRVYTPPPPPPATLIRTYSAPVRVYTPPSPSPVILPSAPIVTRPQYYNPLASNWIIWYLLFFSHNNNVNTSHATTTKN